MSARYPHDDEVCRQNSIDAASFPDLCRQVASLQAERDELRATVKAIADSDGAAMDLWWKASGDGWAVPDHLPGKYLHVVLQAVELRREQEGK